MEEVQWITRLEETSFLGLLDGSVVLNMDPAQSCINCLPFKSVKKSSLLTMLTQTMILVFLVIFLPPVQQQKKLL